MKTLGEQVRAFRLAQAPPWTTSRMAKEVGTSRQNIENLESKGFGQPRYIAGLARVMNCSVASLLGGKDAPSAAAPTSAGHRPNQLEQLLLDTFAAFETDADRIDALHAMNEMLTAKLGRPGAHDPFNGRKVARDKSAPAEGARGRSAFGELDGLPEEKKGRKSK